MCGFGGIINSRQGVSAEAIKKIADAVSHRGPDSTRISLFDNAFVKHEAVGYHAFFFNRLAVVDLDPRSDQPFEDDRHFLLFNGEIYNHHALRGELEEIGVVFRTTSDTEVLFNALRCWGQQALFRLNGMFALFWLDKVTGDFLLARDRIGIKPLYYRKESGSFIFASELHSIVRLSDARPSISAQAVHDYLFFQYVPTPFTILEDIFKLEPGHMIIGSISKLGSGPISTCPYWNAYSKLKVASSTHEDAVLEQLLAESLKMQLEADVPVGLFLSSGIDSSLLAALVNKYGEGRSYDFFSIGFERQTTSDESQDAEAYLRGFGNDNLRHHTLFISPEFIAAKLTTLYKYFDEPFGDSASLLNLAISEKAREYVTVALSGDGADELFWGYPRYSSWQKRFDTINRFETLAGVLRKTAATLPDSRLKYTLMGLLEKDPESAYLFLVSPRMFGEHSPQWRNRQLWYREGLQSLHYRPDLPSIIDFKTYLPDAMLHKVDRSSMASSLEVRVPYLENDIVDFALTMPLYCKSDSQYRTKAPLKRIMSRVAPHYDLRRPKKGFSFPLKSWLMIDWKDMVMDNLIAENLETFQLDHSTLRPIIEDFYKGDESYVMEVWHLLNLALWHNEFKKL